MKKSIRKVVFYWLPVILWGLVVFAFSSYPTNKASEIHWQDFIVKKTAHIVEYAILASLIYRALVAEGVKKKHAGYSAIILAFLYGASDEFHQSFTPGREPTLRDVMIDTVGAILGIYSLWNVLPKAPKLVVEWARKLDFVSK